MAPPPFSERSTISTLAAIATAFVTGGSESSPASVHVFPLRSSVIGVSMSTAGSATSARSWTVASAGAFVIAPAEELFFRNFLYRWLQKGGDWTSSCLRRFDLSAFLWTTALFALEHDRYLAGAMAGAAYGALAIRKGLGAAIVAHVTTNLVLAVYVIARSEWAFW